MCVCVCVCVCAHHSVFELNYQHKIKGQVVLVHAMKEYGGVKVLHSAVDRGKWSGSRLGRFSHEEKTLLRYPSNRRKDIPQSRCKR